MKKKNFKIFQKIIDFGEILKKFQKINKTSQNLEDESEIAKNIQIIYKSAQNSPKSAQNRKISPKSAQNLKIQGIQKQMQRAKCMTYKVYIFAWFLRLKPLICLKCHDPDI